MAKNGSPSNPPTDPVPTQARTLYTDRFAALELTFSAECVNLRAGQAAVAARSIAVDELVTAVWEQASASAVDAIPSRGIALLAIGGYGRAELFPYSDVDLMILLDSGYPEKLAAEPIRRLNQMLWDSGLRVSALTRSMADCEHFDPENVEFSLALLDARRLAGDHELARRLIDQAVPQLIQRERQRLTARLLEVTRKRHQRFGDTLFHLEPNVKECPGGLRDAHVCAWLARIDSIADATANAQTPLFADGDRSSFEEARAFLVTLRTFLHLRHLRDDSVLDWQSQDQAAAVRLGSGQAQRSASTATPPPDAAFWMRLYFRHARVIAQRLSQALEHKASQATNPTKPRTKNPVRSKAPSSYIVRRGEILLPAQPATGTRREMNAAAGNPETVFAIFAEMAASGARLPARTEFRLSEAFPLLAVQLEDGPLLWRYLERILIGPFAGTALRAMHALGILELLIPEFHGIDALVIRDAYHRYTVDEHTFVVIDTIHGLGTPVSTDSPTGLDQTATRLGQVLRDLRHPALLMLAALLHDTGKGHAIAGHPAESARLAANVMRRLELDSFETGLVLDLIRNHLEMSSALRRDVFDRETIRSFARFVATPEALRMLTLFTYADIAAVHPGSLTQWKAENLWLLHMATINFLDRSVDDQRVAAAGSEAATPASALSEQILRIHTLVESESATESLNNFLEGLPRRYLEARTPEQVKAHFEMALKLTHPPIIATPGTAHASAAQIDLRYAPGISELTMVTFDRPRLFALIAGALASWGMNIITADAFSNAHGIVVDSFRFVDRFRTLELNESERDRFVQSLRAIVGTTGVTATETEVANPESRRRRSRKAPKVVVKPRIAFDQTASSHSTIMEVVASDTPGLLRALALTIAEHNCNIEVALVDTEGETAIDVFYLTFSGSKLDSSSATALESSLLKAIEANAA